jgi:hypothetical protein
VQASAQALYALRYCALHFRDQSRCECLHQGVSLVSVPRRVSGLDCCVPEAIADIEACSCALRQVFASLFYFDAGCGGEFCRGLERPLYILVSGQHPEGVLGIPVDRVQLPEPCEEGEWFLQM